MFKIFSKIIRLFPQKNKKRVYALTSGLIISSIFELVGIASIMPFMALLTDPSLIQKNKHLSMLFHAMGFEQVNFFLIFLGVVVLVLLLSSNFVTAFTTYLINSFSNNMAHVLSKRLLTMYLYKPYSFYLMKNTADLGATIFSEVNQVVSGTLLPFLQLISRAFLVSMILGFLVYNDVSLAGSVFLVTGGMYLTMYMSVKNRLTNIGSKRVEANRQRYNIAGEAFGGIKDLKVYLKEQAYIDRFSIPSKEFASYQAQSQTISQLPKYLMESVAFGGLLVISIFTIYSGKQVNQILPLLALYAFAGYRLMPALQMIFNSLTTIKYNHTAIDVFLEDLTKGEAESQEKERKPYDGPEVIKLNDKLEVKDLVFSYPSSDGPVLKKLSLSIGANTTIGFVGSTGSGKTTLIDIILGLLEEQEGGIWADGNQLTNVNREAWLKNVGYVPQSIFLADDTIEQNIAFGVPKDQIDHAAVEKAAQLANIHDFVTRDLSEGYQTQVGERGVRLSGGQRQRIGIARALYNDPQVLIFDEATSALDNVTELAIMEAINKLAHKKTIIMIAHRLSTVKNCDQIFVLEKGIVVEQGTYDQLVRQSKHFREMALVNEKQNAAG